MSKKDRRKLEKKRRKEKAKASGCHAQKAISAYHGNKYKNDKFAELFFHTEKGIYESYILSDKKLTDHEVRRSLENLILRLRAGRVLFSVMYDRENQSEDSIVWNIRNNWQIYLETHAQPARDDVVGVLRSILGSIETWGTIDPKSQGYLRFMQDFMKDLGVIYEKIPPEYAHEFFTEDEFEEEESEVDNDLFDAGLAWIDCEPGAGTIFRALAEEMLDSNEGEQVAETCRQLINETTDENILVELEDLENRAQPLDAPRPKEKRSLLSWLFGK